MPPVPLHRSGHVRSLALLPLAAIALGTLGLTAQAAGLQELAFDDGVSAGARSIAGSGHAVRFSSSAGAHDVRKVRIYGSRYGDVQRPSELFCVWLCDAQCNVLSESRFPLARFEWGNEKWVDLEIEPTRVPREFIVCVGFDPTQYQGVYVHFDNEASGRSLVGIPEGSPRLFELGDWMIRVELEGARPADSADPGFAFLGNPEALYLLNVIIAALAVSGLGLLAAKMAGEGRPRLRHGVLCSVLGLLLLCPLALLLAGHLQVAAMSVEVELPQLPASGSKNPGADTDVRAVVGGRPSDAHGRRSDESNNPAVRSAGAARFIRSAAQFTVVLWIAGALVVLARWMRGMLAIHRLGRSLEPIDCPRMAERAGRAWRTAGLAHDVPIYESTLAPGPLALGVWRAVIVLPKGIEGELSDDELVCVLGHEAAHVARRDAWVAVVQRLATAAFWWNPLLHAINNRIHYARECLCDDCAARACGDSEQLAVALVKVAGWCFGPRTQLAGAALLFDESHLRNRITRLTQGEQTMNVRSTPRMVAALLAVAIAAPAFVLIPTLRAQTQPAARQIPVVPASAKQSKPGPLSYNDGTAEGKKSIAGTGEMVSFTLPDEKDKIAGIRIHGSRYGYPQAPKENVMVYFLNADMSDVVATKTAPYSRFKRGPEGWVELRFPKPIEVPKEFWVCVDFRAERTKGVYVSIDDSTDGSHSRTGLPGMEAKKANIEGDWMIEAVLAK